MVCSLLLGMNFKMGSAFLKISFRENIQMGSYLDTGLSEEQEM